MESIIHAMQAIESEIGVTELRLSALRKSLEALRAIPAIGTVSIMAGAEEPDGRYRGQGVGAALRQFMQNRKSATLDEIRDALGRGGISWGKYPKRQVALAVANSPKLYAQQGDLVTLIPISEPIRGGLMPNAPVQIFWSSVLAQVQDWVSITNKESASQLMFERIPNGFRVCRVSPFLVVERWLADNNQIHGGSEAKDEGGHTIHTMFEPLTITGENESSLPQEPPRRPVSQTTGDVVGFVIGLFQQPGEPTANIASA